MENYADYLSLCAAAAAGGAINSIAGGGTLLTFPALFAALGASEDSANAAVVANATSTVALFPGSLASMAGYRREMAEVPRWALLLIVPSLLGGYFGSRLVTTLPAETFEALVPWLILTAALLFWLQPKIGKWMGIGAEHAPATRRTVAGAIGFQLLVAIYGGYFGAAQGVILLALLGITLDDDLQRLNGVKNVIAAVVNAVAAL
ncbi:MAG TPA: sulfite exporter TauE/SafE family protein, partial [Pirellulales bacterium]|nr:sulfite exporter TauE/SafE family protein [Pirellulales bacterium]